MHEHIRSELQRLIERLGETDPARAEALSKIAGTPLDRQRIRTWRLGHIPESAILAVLLVRARPDDGAEQ